MRVRDLDRGNYPIRHDFIYLQSPEGRCLKLDRGIAPICMLLWANGIQTFFSCEGGPCQIQNRKVIEFKAYVQILTKDVDQAMDILSPFRPKLDKPHKKPVHKDRSCIRFWL